MRNEAPRPFAPTESMGVAIVGGAVCLLWLALVVVVTLGSFISGRDIEGNPIVSALYTVTGDRPLGWGEILVAALMAVGVGYLVRWWWRRRKARIDRRSDLDRKAELMGSPENLGWAAAEKASVDGRLTDGTIPPGLKYAEAVLDGSDLVANYRGTMIGIAGPERGKSTCWTIPFGVKAPGILIAMSNKRDLPDAIRGICEARGQWTCLDPMGIAAYEPDGPTWWWNPLRSIKGPTDAQTLAELWANANTDPKAQKSAFFDSRGPALLGGLLLAAALAGYQMPQVFKWISQPTNDDPVAILLKHGQPSAAIFLRGIYKSTGTEKTGLFSTAANAVMFMVDPAIQAYIVDDGTPHPVTGLPRREFIPEEFVRSRADTLMLLSKEGPGSAGPLTAALTIAVATAAERYADTCPHGRVPTPIVLDGDEIANVWRWQELPKKVTYYGSKGIDIIAIFQNWSQAVGAYGEDGAWALFEASTTRLVGGGLAKAEFLEAISKLIGKYYSTRRSAQHGHGGMMTITPDSEEILSVDELYAMRGRVVVLPAGGYAVLARTVSWMESDYAPLVRASIARFEPSTPVTV